MADEDAPEQTAGYKTPKAATLAEMSQLDANDDAMQKWKASLVKETYAPADDSRRVVVLSMQLDFTGRPSLVLELDTPQKVAAAKTKSIVLKEGCDYRLTVTFRVQHEIVTGLKYHQVVKRHGFRDKSTEMLGSYGPQKEPHSKRFPPEQAPSGMLSRGSYTVTSKFLDDDNNVFLEWDWAFDIKKDWE